ncbi:MAG: TraR/DksA C4-type zinc finger protein, partial [Thermodesulfobacterium sp.]|nr:TraR/DksA C4-type zinc finger protein [Thermodesulfobacterium sp.]
IEYTLELKLRNINLALKKIKEGKYGICEKCHKPIEIERLKARPEAKLCMKCLSKK